MCLDPIEAELGEGLPSNVIEDDELNIVNIYPSDAWATWRIRVVNQMFMKLWCCFKWVPKEDVLLVAYMVDLYNVGTFKANMRFKVGYLNELEKNAIIYDILRGKDNSDFNWGEHMQMVVAKDVMWNSFISVRIIFCFIILL
ncbi:50S ribosomal L3 [Gossypium australe]|uniref:50S ribosomal L3 n=1 Tax=Gossypium australe TaxID=47621 RepID=A0A5B6WRF8_9ROSI|nr:50S ribosomal L3 [Gossypium australe]